MRAVEEIGEIIATYAKHGWKLRRVLLSSRLRMELRDRSAELFAGAEIRDSGVDGSWFSRRSRGDAEAWELRRFGGTPFALFRNIPDETPEGEFESILADAEEELAAAAFRNPETPPN